MTPTAIATPTAAELAAIFCKPGIFSPAKLLNYRLDTICRYAGSQDLPASFDGIAYGIGWAIGTGRLPAAVELKLRGLNRLQLATMFLACVAACPCMGDVPSWLIGRYA